MFSSPKENKYMIKNNMKKLANPNKLAKTFL